MKQILSLLLTLSLILSLSMGVFATEPETKEESIPSTTTKAPESSTKAPTTTTKAPESSTKAPSTTTKAPENNKELPETNTETKEELTETKEDPTETKEESVAVSVILSGVTTPAAGDKIPSDPCENTKIKLLVSQSGKSELQEMTNISTSATWAEKDKPEVILTSGTFVAGRTYRLTVTLEFQENAPKVKSGQTQFSVNRQEATHLSNQGETILFYCDFIAAPKDFTPMVSMEVTGEKTKEYDGKEIILNAKVEKMEGVEYTYTWYKNETELKDATGEILKLKNVSHSGEYSCKVTATLGTEGSGTFKSTQSELVKIEITKHVIILKIKDAKKTLFSGDPEFTYTLKGDIYDELTGNLVREPGEDEGSYEIKIGTLSFSPEVSENYDLQVESGSLKIENSEELPFIKISNIADQSYIEGKGGSKIKISATKGSLGEGNVLTLSLPEATDNTALTEAQGKNVLKSFNLKLLKKEGGEAEFSRHANLQILIPLTEEEEKNFDISTITAAIFNENVISLSTNVVKEGNTTYISLETDCLGTLALFEGVSLVPDVSENTENNKSEKSGSLLVWSLVGFAVILSSGAIVFTAFQINKTNRKPEAKPLPKTLSAEEENEKERKKKIAEELNTLSPIPEEAAEELSPQEVDLPLDPDKIPTRTIPTVTENTLETEEKTGMTTRAFAPQEEIVENAMKTKDISLPNTEKSSEPHQISFEDLED